MCLGVQCCQTSEQSDAPAFFLYQVHTTASGASGADCQALTVVAAAAAALSILHRTLFFASWAACVLVIACAGADH